jgi:hypothetical protein
LGVLDIDGKIILNKTEMAWESVDWIHLAEDWDKEWAFVNAGEILRWVRIYQNLKVDWATCS